MKRRDFLKKVGVGATAAAGAAALMGCAKKEEEKKVEAPAVQTRKKVEWKMVSTWPPKLIYLQTAVDRFVKRVAELTDGNFIIKPYAGGELVPALGTFDAVSKGTVQCGAGVAYYWAGKIPAAQWFGAVPFGLNAQGMYTWIANCGGMKLWEELYEPFNVIPRMAGNTGVQMGGWFNKEINTIDDYKGLKMRIPGLGGKVVAKAGGTVVLLPGGEIFTSLERGVIDATEWIGPLHDKIMGFYKVAKYYYYPGWHEPGPMLEHIFNKQAFEKLPRDYQVALETATAETHLYVLCGFEADNGAALQELISEHNVVLKAFPKPVLDTLKQYTDEVIQEIIDKDPMAKKVDESFRKAQKQIGIWGTISEKAYYDRMMQDYGI